MRLFSTRARRALFDTESDDPVIVLITITPPDFDPIGGANPPIRVSSDPTVRLLETPTEVIYGTVSRGMQFPYLPFGFDLPTDEDEAPPSFTLTVDNVSLALTDSIRSMSENPSVTMEIVMASSPDLVEMVFRNFLLIDVTIDRFSITGRMSMDSLDQEAFPAGMFTPASFPALFR